MNLKALELLALLAACMAPTAALADCIEDSQTVLLALSDRALYDVALNGIEDSSGAVNCRIINTIGTGDACDLYVKVYPPKVPGHDGWPLDWDDKGTGCVRAPDMPKRMDTCFYVRTEYSTTLMAAVTSSFCTNNGKENAVAQLRHAILAGACSFCTK